MADENQKSPISVPVPASPDSSGEPGQVAYDTEYLYVCAAPNVWLRVNLAVL